MRLNVSPNRMTLLMLKKKLILARQGHNLLKDKLDELMRYFLELIEDVKKLHDEVEKGLDKAFKNFLVARLSMSSQSITGALLSSQVKTKLEKSLKVLMNLRIPQYKAEVKGDIFGYGFVNTTSELDTALQSYVDVLPKMIRLAQLQKALEMMAQEIESTRRRVNALEYILIPNLIETIRYIKQKLAEMERGDLTRLMKVKDIVRAH